MQTHVAIRNGRIFWYSSYFDSESKLFLCAAELLGTYPDVRIVLDSDWQVREATRFLNGSYKPMPDYFPSLPGHFLHISKENPALVAYTESDAKGLRDIQTSCKPGRYLTKYFSALGNVEIEKITKLLPAGDSQSLAFANTRAEIRRVYPAIHRHSTGRIKGFIR